MLPIEEYRTIIFDCDGVVLNSNKVKTEAFYKAALPYGEKAALELVEHHVRNGGISRYKKFTHFMESILPPSSKGPTFEEMLHIYAKESWQGLLECELASGLDRLKKNCISSNWLIVSGGDQEELRRLFSLRGISELFDGGIFGSPDSKSEILAREMAAGNIRTPAVFIGDSKYDLTAAQGASLDFIFCSDWSEVADRTEWLPKESRIVKNINGLL